MFLKKSDQGFNAYIIYFFVTALKYIQFVYVKVIYLYEISKTSSTDDRQPELNCVIKLGNCCVLFPEILAWNVALDKADC